MAKFTYTCDYPDEGGLFGNGTHSVELEFPIGKAPADPLCPHHKQHMIRNIAADVLSCRIDPHGDDPFRKYHLSWGRERAEGEQQRRIEGPRDRQEARDMGKALGRTYIGNDTSALTPREQRSLEKRG